MSGLRRLERFAPLLGLLVSAAILLVGLGRHGIWDPTELSFAESLTGSHRLEGVPLLKGSLVRAGFELFGRRDWQGRVFGASAALLAAVSALGLARRHLDGRAAAYASVLAAATPLVVLNARWMVGDGASLGLHSLVGLGLFVAAFDRTRENAIAPTPTSMRVVGLIVASAAAVGVVLFRGALLGVLPPLLAVAGVALIEPSRTTSGRIRAAIAVVGIGLLLVLAFLVARDAASFSVMLGGIPGGESPPTFERFLKIAFHTLAPVSPLFVIGAVRAVRVDAEDEVAVERQRFALGLVLWATFSFGATTLFASRYGVPTFLAVVPVAVLAAVTLREAETTRPFDLTEVLVLAMLLGLLLRDYALYPASPLAGVPVTAPTLAADFQPRRIWALLFLTTGIVTCFAGASHVVDGKGFRAIGDFYRRAVDWLFTTPSGNLTLGAAAVVELALVLVGAFGQSMHVASIVLRIVRPLAVLFPVVIPAVTLLVLGLLHGFAALRAARMIPTVLAIAAFGAYVQGPFLVELSGDLSPRGVFEAFNELRHRGERLGRFDVGSHAFEYYVDGRALDLETRQALIDHLTKPPGERTWAMFHRNILPQIDREVRTRTGHHLFLAHAENSEFVLATNSPIAGRTDANPLTRAVITAAEAHPQHPLAIRFRDVELIGYDLSLPNGGSIGAGQSFRVTWYWKAHSRTGVNWKVFLHVDGDGQRLNGDHDPVEGLLPTNEWVAGDVVRDTQELTVPATYGADDYTMYIGLFSGNDRMPIVSGPDGGENRGIAGTLRVR